MPDGLDLTPVWLTLRLALVTTAILLPLATPLAWWLARSGSRARGVVEALVALPLVLPPTVLGFYLLVFLNPQSWLGKLWLTAMGDSLAFSFEGLVLASLLYSLPFAVQPLRTAFAAVDPRLLEAAATLRAGPMDRFRSVVMPLSRQGYLSAGVLAFAHTVGEFGVVLMIGGNIPGETQVLSIAIYEQVETINYSDAHALSAGLLLFSFAVLLLVYSRRRPITLAGG